MKFSICSIIGCVALIEGVTAATCNANNCARAVTGTAQGLLVQASRKRDCSSFLQATVTPTTTTFTVYATVVASTDISVSTILLASTKTTTTTGAAVINTDLPQKRQVTVKPSAIPAYASACTRVNDYSSACSCFGVTQTTTTLPTPSTTLTITNSQTTLTTTLTTSTSVTTVTSSVAAPIQTSCSSAQNMACGNCFCNINVLTGAPECADTEACPNAASATNPACSTDADCTTLLNRPGYVCEYNVDGFCRGGRVCGRRQSAATCNSRQSKKAKRELEKVFDDAGNAYLLSHAASTIEKRKSRVERK